MLDGRGDEEFSAGMYEEDMSGVSESKFSWETGVWDKGWLSVLGKWVTGVWEEGWSGVLGEWGIGVLEEGMSAVSEGSCGRWTARITGTQAVRGRRATHNTALTLCTSFFP